MAALRADRSAEVLESTLPRFFKWWVTFESLDHLETERHRVFPTWIQQKLEATCLTNRTSWYYAHCSGEWIGTPFVHDRVSCASATDEMAVLRGPTNKYGFASGAAERAANSGCLSTTAATC